MTDAQEKQDTHLPEQHELDIVLELSTAFPQHLPSHMNFSPVESDHRGNLAPAPLVPSSPGCASMGVLT